MIPKTGDIVIVGRDASVQFAGSAELIFRVIGVRQKTTYQGWMWITGYALDRQTGAALERREIFVQVAGLRPYPREARWA